MAAQRPKGPPVRTCVGCRQEAGKRSLIRLVRRPEGGAKIDPTGHAAGRGAYLHADPACIDLARKRRALERALRTTIQPDLGSELDTVGSERAFEIADLTPLDPEVSNRA